jgi:hypothetical protein
MIWEMVRKTSSPSAPSSGPGSNGSEGQPEYTYTVDEDVTLIAGIANPFFWAYLNNWCKNTVRYGSVTMSRSSGEEVGTYVQDIVTVDDTRLEVELFHKTHVGG